MAGNNSVEESLPSGFPITPSELVLRFSYPEGERRLSFKNYGGWNLEAWRNQCRTKLRELLNFHAPEPCVVKELRRRTPEWRSRPWSCR